MFWKEDKSKADTQAAELDQLKQVVQGLESQLGTALGTLQKQTEYINQFVTGQQQATRQADAPPAGQVPTPPSRKGIKDMTDEELDMMSPRELMKLTAEDTILAIQEKLMPSIGNQIKDISEKVEAVSSNYGRTKAQSDIEAMRQKDPDFDSWQDEVTKVAQTNPGLELSEMLALAKYRNPEKAAKLEAVRQEQNRNKPDYRLEGQYGGLESSVLAKPGGDMSIEDAANMAASVVGIG